MGEPDTPSKDFVDWQRQASATLGVSKEKPPVLDLVKEFGHRRLGSAEPPRAASSSGAASADWISTRVQPLQSTQRVSSYSNPQTSNRSLLIAKAAAAENAARGVGGQLAQLKTSVPTKVISPEATKPQLTRLKRPLAEVHDGGADAAAAAPAAKRPREAITASAAQPSASSATNIHVVDDDSDGEDLPVTRLQAQRASVSSAPASSPTLAVSDDDDDDDIVVGRGSLGSRRGAAPAPTPPAPSPPVLLTDNDVSFVAEEVAGGGRGRLRRQASAASGSGKGQPSKAIVDLSEDEEQEEDDDEGSVEADADGVDDDDEFEGEEEGRGRARSTGSSLARALGLSVEEGEAFDALIEKARQVQEDLKATLADDGAGRVTDARLGVTPHTLAALLGTKVARKGEGVTATSNLSPSPRRQAGSKGAGGEGADPLPRSSSSKPSLSLAPHQLIGVAWLVLLYRQGVGGLLADAMGLGKTVQVCTALSYVAAAFGDTGPHLIVCPGSTLGNWQRELAVWCPALRVGVYRGGPTRYQQQAELMDARRGARGRSGSESDGSGSSYSDEEDAEEDAYGSGGSSDEDDDNESEDVNSGRAGGADATPSSSSSSSSSSRGFDVLITTYTLFDRADASGEASPDYAFLKSFRYSYLVLDEGHAVKNAASIRHRKLTRIRAQHRLLLSGTPLQNSLPELFALLRLLQPDVFTRGSEKAFEQAEAMYRRGEGASIVNQLRSVLNPFILRRSKEEVMSSLPPKTDDAQVVTMVPEQAAMYAEVVAAVGTLSGLRAATPASATTTPTSAGAASAAFTGGGEGGSQGEAGSVASSAHMASDAALAAQLAAEELQAAGRKVPRDIAQLLEAGKQGGSAAARPRRTSSGVSAGSSGSASATGAVAAAAGLAGSGHLDLGVRLDAPGARLRNGALSGKTMMSLFTALRKATQHPLLLRRWYTHEPTLRRLAACLLQVGAFGPNVEVGVERALQALRDMSDLEIHGMCATNGATSVALTALRAPNSAASGNGQIVTAGGPRPAARGEGGWLGPSSFKAPASPSEAPLIQLDELAAAAGLNPDRLPPREVLRLCVLPTSALQHSGKVAWLSSYLPAAVAEGHRVLLFSQWTTVLDILGELLNVLRIGWLRLDGSTDVDTRQALIDTFTRDHSIGVFLLSTRAGGLGLNLTAADTVIIHDCDWNPHNDRQAVDRAHRMGQTRPVTVLRLRCAGTVDETVEKIAARKMDLDAAFGSSAEQGGSGGGGGGSGRGGRRSGGGGDGDAPDDVPVSELLAAALSV